MNDAGAAVSIKFSGDIIVGGEVNLRDLANAFTHLQSMLDRAYIDIKTAGKIRKHSRLKQNEYEDINFSVQDPERKSYLVNMLSKTTMGTQILDRINAAISPIHRLIETEVSSEFSDIAKDVERVRQQVNAGIIQASDYNEEEIRHSKSFIRTFGDKAILKYFDQLVAPTRAKEMVNFFDLTLSTDKIYNYKYDKTKSNRLHRVITSKMLGSPRVIKGQLVGADWHNRQGTFVKYTNGRKCNLKFSTRDEVEELSRVMGIKGITIVACPVIEFGSYDAESGDLQFVSILDHSSLSHAS